jgi:REP element-mobilizing transposase RayT
MPLHKKIEKKGIYFVTFTCASWLPLIQLTNSYSSAYSFFSNLTEKGNTILAYVIMPNHIHFMIYFNGNGYLNTLIGNGKRFMAYEIISVLQSMEKNTILARLKKEVSIFEYLRGKLHQVWERTVDIKECRTERFALQKLNYIHINPMKGKWKLCETIIDYPHSSAIFYVTGKQSSFPVKDYREFLDWENMYDE